MKRLVLSVIIMLAIVFAVILAIRFLSGPEDTWICQNNEWVKHGQPSGPKPTEPCGKIIEELVNTPQVNAPVVQPSNDKIKVSRPLSNDLVSSPLEIAGEARGYWYFEASFPVKLLGANDKVIASGIAQAQGDWMTENFVPFKATLSFTQPEELMGFLVLEKDNPSGLPENADEIKIPVRFK